jgi:hypothetical protein
MPCDAQARQDRGPRRSARAQALRRVERDGIVCEGSSAPWFWPAYRDSRAAKLARTMEFLLNPVHDLMWIGGI